MGDIIEYLKQTKKEFRFQHKQKWYVMRIEEMKEGGADEAG